MKTILLVIVAFVSITTAAQSTFQWDTNDTIETNLNLNTYDQYPMYQSAVGNDTVTLAIEIIHNDLPQSWDGMVCVYGLCMGSIPAVGTQTTMDPIYGSNQGMIRLTVNPFNGMESAKLQVKVWDVAFPNEADTATFILNRTANTLSLDANRIQITPNPVVNTFHIDAEYDWNAIQIFDLSGRMTKTFETSTLQQELDVADLPKGVYTIRLMGDLGTLEKRLLKL